MVKQISAAIKVVVTESDDAKHRYVLYKEWDKDKPACTIITLFPGSAELVITDTTQMLITNQLYKMGYGSFYSVNLFSKVGISARGQKAFANATNKTNDDTILDCVGKSKAIIFAWGSLPDKNKVAKQRVEVLVSKMNPYLGSCFHLTDANNGRYFHPLSPNVRADWFINPLQ